MLVLSQPSGRLFIKIMLPDGRIIRVRAYRDDRKRIKLAFKAPDDIQIIRENAVLAEKKGAKGSPEIHTDDERKRA